GRLVISVARRKRNRCRAKVAGVHDILPESCGVGGETGSWCRAVGRAQQAAGTFECARYKLDGEEAVTLERTGHAQGRGHFRREAKAVVIGRVADENDRAVAPPPAPTHPTAPQPLP